MMKKHLTKGLYVAFHDLNPAAGVSKKILAQVEAFRANGIEMSLMSYSKSEGERKAYIGNECIGTVFSGVRYYLKLSGIYKKIINYIINNEVELLYIRYTQNSDPLFNRFLKKCKDLGCVILLEIPTYPYDGEFANQNYKLKLQLFIEKKFRNGLKNIVDYIVTTSEFENILGIKTIKISNAVNPSAIPLKRDKRLIEEFTFISVATISFWHGLDRLIVGIQDYLKKENHISIKLLIIGGGDPNEINKIKRMICEYNLGHVIQYLGPKYGKELDELYEKADIAVGCLGCHRKNIEEVKSLKNVEYAMRGLPFFYSERNSDFDGRPYVYKVPANETSINVESVISFYRDINLTSQEIRNSVSSFTWDEQMRKIISLL